MLPFIDAARCLRTVASMSVGLNRLAAEAAEPRSSPCCSNHFGSADVPDSAKISRLTDSAASLSRLFLPLRVKCPGELAEVVEQFRSIASNDVRPFTWPGSVVRRGGEFVYVLEHRSVRVENRTPGCRVQGHAGDGESDVENVIARKQGVIRAAVGGLEVDVPIRADPPQTPPAAASPAADPAPPGLSSTHTENGTPGGTTLSTPSPRQLPGALIRRGASAGGRKRSLSGTSWGLHSSHPTILVSVVSVPPAIHSTAPVGPSSMTCIGRRTSAWSRSKSKRRNDQVTVSPGIQKGPSPT